MSVQGTSDSPPSQRRAQSISRKTHYQTARPTGVNQGKAGKSPRRTANMTSLARAERAAWARGLKGAADVTAATHCRWWHTSYVTMAGLAV